MYCLETSTLNSRMKARNRAAARSFLRLGSGHVNTVVGIVNVLLEVSLRTVKMQLEVSSTGCAEHIRLQRMYTAIFSEGFAQSKLQYSETKVPFMWVSPVVSERLSECGYGIVNNRTPRPLMQSLLIVGVLHQSCGPASCHTQPTV